MRISGYLSSPNIICVCILDSLSVMTPSALLTPPSPHTHPHSVFPSCLWLQGVSGICWVQSYRYLNVVRYDCRLSHHRKWTPADTSHEGELKREMYNKLFIEAEGHILNPILSSGSKREVIHVVVLPPLLILSK